MQMFTMNWGCAKLFEILRKETMLGRGENNFKHIFLKSSKTNPTLSEVILTPCWPLYVIWFWRYWIKLKTKVFLNIWFFYTRFKKFWTKLFLRKIVVGKFIKFKIKLFQDYKKTKTFLAYVSECSSYFGP